MSAEEKALLKEEGTEIAAETEEKQDAFLPFKKPYHFEEKDYDGIDMSGMSKLTVKDAIDTQRELFAQGEYAAAMLTETSTAFARTIAAKATGMPIEFFQLAPRGVSRRVTATVQAYLSAEDGADENHVLTFVEPYTFKGKEYTKIDLSELADLTGMNESEAENRIARAGFMVTDTSFNYLYACVLASMVTKLPEEFFTGLPIRETIRLKNAVNDPGFFE